MNALFTILSFLSLTIVADYTGTWTYMSPTPDGGSVEANFEFWKEDGQYVGKVFSKEGELPLDDLKIEGDAFSAHFDYQGYIVRFKGTFDGDTLKASGEVEGFEFPIVAKKKTE